MWRFLGWKYNPYWLKAQLSLWRSHTMPRNDHKKVVSTFAFLVNFMFMIPFIQIIGGALPKGCNVFGLLDVTPEECKAFGTAFLGNTPTEKAKDFFTLVLVIPRVEAALFLGMGMGSVYAYVFF